MDFWTQSFQGFLSGIGPFFILLGLLIFVHELGHFLVAKYYGVRVETFSLGFGKKIFKYKHGDTTYCISIIPLGGYVKMFGDDPTKELSEEEKKYSFLHKPVGQRIWIVLAGPLMNLFFAGFLFALIGYMGEEVPGPKLGDIEHSTEAYLAGFKSGDEITHINGNSVRTWKDVTHVVERSAGQSLQFTVKREGDEGLAEVKAVPKLRPNPFIFTTRREVGIIEGLTTDSKAAIVGVKDPGAIAAQIGLKDLDLIEEINGTRVHYFRQLDDLFKDALASGHIDVKARSMLESGSDSRSLSFTLNSPIEAQTPALERMGLESAELYFMSIRRGSPASLAGLQPGDRILSINGQELNEWNDLLESVKTFRPEEGTLKVAFRRADERKEIEITPELTQIPTAQGSFDDRYAIGVVPALLSTGNPFVTLDFGLLGSIQHGAVESWNWSKLIVISFARLIQNEVSPRNIGGVITIGRVASHSYDAGITIFLKMMAIISINLFILNLLPIPVLDGGHLVFFTIEAIKGAPLSLKKMEIAQQVGLVLLLGLMVFALFNDIANWLTAW